MKKFLILFSGLLLTVSLGHSQIFSFKLMGGMGYAIVGDYNQGIQGMMAQLNDEDADYSGGWEKLNKGMSFGGELIFHLTPNLGLGLGASFFQLSKSSSIKDLDTGDVVFHDYTIRPRISVVPLMASFHYFLPISPKLKLDFMAGAGYYITKFHHEDDLDVTAYQFVWPGEYIPIDAQYNYTFDSSQGASGFHGGLGLEFEVAPNIDLVFNVIGRYAVVSDFKGNWTEKSNMSSMFGSETDENSGSGHYFWFYHEKYSGKTYACWTFENDKPDWTDVTDADKGKINLSGVTATVGIKIGF